MSFVHRFFSWFENLDAKRSLVRIPPDIKEELLAVGLHLAVATADIRTPVSTRVTATDATPQRGGAVECTVSIELSEALYDACESRGRRVRLDRGPMAVFQRMNHYLNLIPLCQKCHAVQLGPQLAITIFQRLNTSICRS